MNLNTMARIGVWATVVTGITGMCAFGLAFGYLLHSIWEVRHQTHVEEVPASKNTSLSLEIGNAFAPDVKDFFAEHDGLAAMVVTSISADGGVHVLTAGRDPNFTPSRMLQMSIDEMRAIEPTVDGQTRQSHPIKSKPEMDL